MGQLLRIAMDPKPALSEGSGANESVKEHYAYLSKTLASVQIIDDSGETIRNCAAISLDGKEQVFYAIGGSTLTLYLWEKATGKSRQVATDEDSN